MARLRQLNEISLESARKRLSEKRNEDWVPGGPFIGGAILSSIFNYIPWKAFLKKLDEYLLQSLKTTSCIYSWPAETDSNPLGGLRKNTSSAPTKQTIAINIMDDE